MDFLRLTFLLSMCTFYVSAGTTEFKINGTPAVATDSFTSANINMDLPVNGRVIITDATVGDVICYRSRTSIINTAAGDESLGNFPLAHAGKNKSDLSEPSANICRDKAAGNDPNAECCMSLQETTAFFLYGRRDLFQIYQFIVGAASTALANTAVATGTSKRIIVNISLSAPQIDLSPKLSINEKIRIPVSNIGDRVCWSSGDDSNAPPAITTPTGSGSTNNIGSESCPAGPVSSTCCSPPTTAPNYFVELTWNNARYNKFKFVQFKANTKHSAEAFVQVADQGLVFTNLVVKTGNTSDYTLNFTGLPDGGHLCFTSQKDASVAAVAATCGAAATSSDVVEVGSGTVANTCTAVNATALKWLKTGQNTQINAIRCLNGKTYTSATYYLSDQGMAKCNSSSAVSLSAVTMLILAFGSYFF